MTLLAVAACGVGCESGDHDEHDDAGSRALRDPMNYSPGIDKPASQQQQKQRDADERDGLRRDLDHVFNP